MIKRTLYFGNPAYLSLKNAQLVIKLPEVEHNDTLPTAFKQNLNSTIPIEDIGIIVLDNQQITITEGVLAALLDNQCAVISCNNSHLPTGLFLPLCGNSLQNERFRNQLNASLPLQKQLWQQTIQYKIRNQRAVLTQYRMVETGNMLEWASSVTSGDTTNLEGRAAVYYWSHLFPNMPDFIRGRDELPPNNLLNYGYAILRAVVARSLVCSGLLPTLGIHHHNRYNAYCLADDIMEPYRPYVDELVIQITDCGQDYQELTPSLKKDFLSIPIIDVKIDGKRSPLMQAVSLTTASLSKCFGGETRKILYPDK